MCNWLPASVRISNAPFEKNRGGPAISLLLLYKSVPKKRIPDASCEGESEKAHLTRQQQLPR